jgi:hypothetical protein
MALKTQNSKLVCLVFLVWLTGPLNFEPLEQKTINCKQTETQDSKLKKGAHSLPGEIFPFTIAHFEVP